MCKIQYTSNKNKNLQLNFKFSNFKNFKNLKT